VNIQKTVLITCIFFVFLGQLIPQVNQIDSIMMTKTLSAGPLVLVQEDEPVSGIVQIGNQTSGENSILIVGFLTKILAFNYDTSEVLWDDSTKSDKYSDVFIWKIIPNALLEEEVSGAYVSLSNGTVIEISSTGQVSWKTSLGSTAISNLVLVEASSELNVSFYIVAGGDNNKVTWLTPDGNEVESSNTSTEITIIATEDIYSLVGTRAGDIYVFNGTEILWSLNVGDNQVLALELYQNMVITHSYGNHVKFINLDTESVEFTSNYGLLTYDSIQVLDQVNNIAYLFKINGELVAIRVSDGQVLWNNTEIPSYATNIHIGEFTGDMKEDLAVGTVSGALFVLNSSSGQTIYSEEVIDSQISFLLKISLDQIPVADLLIGTLNGKIIAVLGSDRTPPLISGLYYDQLAFDSYNITVVANEAVTADVKYGINSINENTKVNETHQVIHTFILEDLKPESNYFGKVIIHDDNNNTATSEVFFLNTSSVPTPFPLVEFSLGIFLILGLGGTAYLYNQRRVRQRSLIYGEEALKYNDYSNAIRYFYKAKAKERVVEVAKILILNPELSREMSEIRKLKELEEYITAAQEMLEQSQEK
jgi:hypothetical protein